MCIDEKGLSQLPEHRTFSQLRVIAVDCPATDGLPTTTTSTSSSAPTTSTSPADTFPITCNSATVNEPDDPYNAHLSQSFVPTAMRSMTEQEALVKSVEERQSSSSASPSRDTLAWPTIGRMPVNEFTTEGYISCAFPTLFPTGAADFSGQRQIPVTIGNYFKHLMMYEDSRFAIHPRFRFFALNTEMRWRALQTGRVYVKQHPGDAQLSLDELRDMVGRQGEAFSSRVLHYASSLRGTKQYWYRQRSRLLAMVDTLGLPTIFFTHSAADLQWPELACLICPEDPNSRSNRAKALIENPARSDWFFYYRVMEFIKAFYVEVLGATDYWMRFEWQHRGSPHVHGLAWLPHAPDVEKLLSSHDVPDSVKAQVINYADSLVSTMNPAVFPDGSNIDSAPAPKIDPHVCNKVYGDVNDLDQDLMDLVATCQRHTRCSAAYCLRTRNRQQECRFGYPKLLQPRTEIITEEEPTLLTARNDGMINNFNPIQLSTWRANLDMQYIVSRHRVIEYCTKYVTKSEPQSQSLKEVYVTIVRSLQEGNTSLKVVQKLLINTAGARDYSAQETCHLLLQLPMFKTSRDFIILSLDGSRAVEDRLEQHQSATAASIVDHYMQRPATASFNDLPLIEFARQYSMPKTLGSQPTRRSKQVVVIPRPYCSPDPSGPKYEQYCCQTLMLHKCFRHMNDLFAGCEYFVQAFSTFLQSGNIPPCLEDDVYRLQRSTTAETEESIGTEVYVHLIKFKGLWCI